MKKTIILLAVALCVMLPTLGHAQFDKGTTMLGPHIGFGYYGGALAIGGKLEVPVTKAGEAGPGVIGIGVRLDYLAIGDGYSLIGVAGTANYHFKFGDGKWDPYLGLGLGYFSFSGGGFYGSSRVFVTGSAGIRYYFSRNTALRAEFSSDLTYFVVGIDFGL